MPPAVNLLRINKRLTAQVIVFAMTLSCLSQAGSEIQKPTKETNASTVIHQTLADSIYFRDLEIPDQSGKIMTVSGYIDPMTLGDTLMHEHIFIDLRQGHKEQEVKNKTPDKLVPGKPLFSLYNRSQSYTTASADLFYIHSVEDAVKEVLLYKKLGGKTIVNVTTINAGRKPLQLRQVAKATGTNIIAATGFYHTVYLPEDIGQRSVDDLTFDLLSEIVVGIKGTDVKAGIIGEIGAENIVLVPEESHDVRILRASARASRLSGAAISLHGSPLKPETWHTLLDILEEEGANLSRVIVGHVGAIAASDLHFLESLLARGVYLQFDLLGWPPAPLLRVVDQRPMLDAIINLVRLGYSEKMLVSHDAATKAHMAKNGGWGLTYVHTALLPYLRENGVDEISIKNILQKNPQDILRFDKPGGVKH